MATIEFEALQDEWQAPEPKRRISNTELVFMAGTGAAAVAIPAIVEFVDAAPAGASEIHIDTEQGTVSVTFENGDVLGQVTKDVNAELKAMGQSDQFTQDELAKAGHIDNPDLIIAGHGETAKFTPTDSTPTAPETASDETYIVKKNDTIYDIANGDPALMKAYIKVNNLRTSADGKIAYIQVGQKLIRPSATGDMVVKKGQTVIGLAHGDAELAKRIIEVNHIPVKEVNGKQVAYIYENQVLVNPASGLKVTPAPTAQVPLPNPPAKPAETPSPPASPEVAQAKVDLPQVTKDRAAAAMPAINNLMDEYQKAEDETGVPKEIMAALHFREANNNPTRTVNNGQPLGDVNIDDGKPTSKELQQNIIDQANALKHIAKAVYGVDVGPNMTEAQVGLAALAYNRGAMYKNASKHGIDLSWQDSPYASAGLPGKVDMPFPDVGHFDPADGGRNSWGEPESVHGKADKRIGVVPLVMPLGYFDRNATEPVPAPVPPEPPKVVDMQTPPVSAPATPPETAPVAPKAELTDQQKLDFLKAAIRNNAVAAAKSQLGINEASGIPMQRYSMGANEKWCADFASWINDQAGLTLQPGPGVLDHGRAPSTVTWYQMALAGQSHMKFHSDEEVAKGDYVAQPGDKILMRYPSSTNHNPVNHIKTVVAEAGDHQSIVNIGGNESDSVKESQLSVHDPNIVGVIDVLDH